MSSATQPSSERGTAANEAIEVVKTVVYALLIALVLRVLLFQPFTIPSASMEPTLLQGDYIIVSKYSYGYSRHSVPFSPPIFKGRLMESAPRRGDVIVFKLPRDGHTDYIKRLIGMPGDRLQVKQGVVFINDKPLARKELSPGFTNDPYTGPGPVKRYLETNPEGRQYVTYDFAPDRELDNTGVYVVPQGHYFMMGDNRDNSQDSRVSAEALGVGYVPAENLVGRAQIILLSWNADAALFKPWTWFTDARPERFFRLLK